MFLSDVQVFFQKEFPSEGHFSQPQTFLSSLCKQTLSLTLLPEALEQTLYGEEVYSPLRSALSLYTSTLEGQGDLPDVFVDAQTFNPSESPATFWLACSHRLSTPIDSKGKAYCKRPPHPQDLWLISPKGEKKWIHNPIMAENTLSLPEGSQGTVLYRPVLKVTLCEAQILCDESQHAYSWRLKLKEVRP